MLSRWNSEWFQPTVIRLAAYNNPCIPWTRYTPSCVVFFFFFFLSCYKGLALFYGILLFFFFFFSQQSKLVMEGFRSLKEGEQVEFTYKKSSKGLESLRVTGPGGGPCAGSERRPKGKVPLQKRKPKGDRWVLPGKKIERPEKWQERKKSQWFSVSAETVHVRARTPHQLQPAKPDRMWALFSIKQLCL